MTVVIVEELVGEVARITLGDEARGAIYDQHTQTQLVVDRSKHGRGRRRRQQWWSYSRSSGRIIRNR